MFGLQCFSLRRGDMIQHSPNSMQNIFKLHWKCTAHKEIVIRHYINFSSKFQSFMDYYQLYINHIFPLDYNFGLEAVSTESKSRLLHIVLCVSVFYFLLCLSWPNSVSHYQIKINSLNSLCIFIGQKGITNIIFIYNEIRKHAFLIVYCNSTRQNTFALVFTFLVKHKINIPLKQNTRVLLSLY